MSDKVGVACIRYVCPICGKDKEELSAIAINRRLTNADARKIEALHNKIIGFSDKPCNECQSYIDKGAFFIIGVDVDKTEDKSNPYRSGHLVGISKESEFYKQLDANYKKKDACYMDYREMKQIGLI